MQAQTNVYWQKLRVTGRLHELEVREVILQEAVKLAARYFMECTENDPPGGAGQIAYIKVVRSLRDQLLPLKWMKSNTGGLATVIHPKLRFAIAAASGDASTGIKDKTPSTRNPKGPVTEQTVTSNQLGFEGWSADFKKWSDDNNQDAAGVQVTWWLLFYIDLKSEEIRLELSLPAGLSDGGYITKWQQRIILEPVKLTPTPIITDSDAAVAKVIVSRKPKAS